MTAFNRSVIAVVDVFDFIDGSSLAAVEEKDRVAVIYCYFDRLIADFEGAVSI